MGANQLEVKWEPPDVGWTKINTDAAINENGRRGSIGVVACNHYGEFVLARGYCYEGITDPETMELLACRDAMQLAAERGMEYLVVETDCSSIKKLWESKAGECPAHMHVFSEMRSLVNTFQGFKLLSVSCNANKVAHCMAKEALSSNSVLNFDVIPGYLLALVQAEKLQLYE